MRLYYFISGCQFENILKQSASSLLICSGRLHAQGFVPMSLFFRAARLNSLFHHGN